MGSIFYFGIFLSESILTPNSFNNRWRVLIHIWISSLCLVILMFFYVNPNYPANPTPQKPKMGPPRATNDTRRKRLFHIRTHLAPINSAGAQSKKNTTKIKKSSTIKSTLELKTYGYLFYFHILFFLDFSDLSPNLCLLWLHLKKHSARLQGRGRASKNIAVVHSVIHVLVDFLVSISWILEENMFYSLLLIQIFK